MLRLIITGDKRTVRETISTVINWKGYDIEVVGLCKNRTETYDMVMDKAPDTMLTDIRMPGINGLELIRGTSGTNLNVQLIVLSGYGELEYAKEVMKNRVKYYPLKPCNELRIIDCIEQYKKDCYQQGLIERTISDRLMAINDMSHNVIFSIISDSICQDRGLPGIIRSYESYIDFKLTVYRLHHVYFLPFKHPEEFLDDLRLYCSQNISSVIIHGVYANNTLLLFFRNFAANYQDLERFICQRYYPGQVVALETESIPYLSLEQLLVVVLKKTGRFGMICYISSSHLLYTCSYNTHINESGQPYQSTPDRRSDFTQKLADLIRDIDGITFLKQIASNLFVGLTLNSPYLSSIWLTKLPVWTENEQCLADLESLVINQVEDVMRGSNSGQPVNTVTQQISDYVSRNLQDNNLTLEYTSKNCLFMDVGYISKKFLKETGTKFSAYLTDMRIKTAKQLLAFKGLDKIQDVAQEVGLRNSPQYSSQLSKKKTGIAPSAYITQILGRPCK